MLLLDWIYMICFYCGLGYMVYSVTELIRNHK